MGSFERDIKLSCGFWFSLVIQFTVLYVAANNLEAINDLTYFPSLFTKRSLPKENKFSA